jgi:antitoxin HicB
VEQKRTFTIVLEPEEEGGFTVRVPSIPEIATYGKDEREAIAMAEDAIRLVLEDCAARGEPLPNSEPPASARLLLRWQHEPATPRAQGPRSHPSP